MIRLLRVDDATTAQLLDATRHGGHPRLPGAARMSFGLGTTIDDIETAAVALESIATDGPGWTYRVDEFSAEHEPDPDPRPLPDLGVRLVEHPHGHGESA
jgi:hypothetical protein